MLAAILKKLGGNAIGEVVDTVGRLIDESTMTEQEKAEARASTRKELTESAHRSDDRQTEQNVQGAKHRSLFVAGWRPFIGWMCGTTLGIGFLGGFVVSGIIAVAMVVDPVAAEVYRMAGDYYHESTKWIVNESGKIIVGMLGLMTLRTGEKWLGLTK